jgi:tetratricopeptide (TPR) repeat protein
MQKTILFLAANPKKTEPTNLKREVEAVKKGLARLQPQRHEQFVFKQEWAKTPEEVQHALLEHKPHVVHFSEYGAGQAGIILENEAGEEQIVSGDTLAHFFEPFPDIECVIFNARFGTLQAAHIVKHIHFVISMNQPINLKAAILFSIGFYDALAAGKSIINAFRMGRVRIKVAMPKESEHLKPVLKQHFTKTLWQMPIPENRFFTGRESVLNQLQDTLHFRQVVALSGLGGMGKTQIAAQYALSHRYEYQAVLWCLADGLESLHSGLVAMAHTLGLPETPEQRIAIAAVKGWLATHTHWLLVLDNADELRIVGELITLAKGGERHILLTTRAQMTEPYAKSVVINEISREEGIHFLLRRALDKPHDKNGEVQDYKPTDKTNVGKLVDMLGALPLALDQAGAYIRETQCGLEGYLARYQTDGYTLLQERGTLFSEQNHSESVAITWLLSFEKITAENPTAIEILYLCAFLHPDNIPEEIFQDADLLALDKALKVILKYSFVQRNPKTKILTIHRLVQTILRHEMDEATQRGWAEKAVLAVTRVFPDPEALSNRSTCERLLPCAQTCAELIDKWALKSEEAGHLLNQIGYYLRNAKGDNEQAKPLYERALAIWEKAHGEEHPDIAQSLNNLAEIYKAQGSSEQAKPLYERALAIWEKAHGEEHPLVATNLNNLAVLYKAQNDIEQAKALYERALAIREKVFVQEHPLIAISLNNLAEVYRTQGDYEQAKPLYERSLAIWEKVHGKEHPSVATSLNNLALLYKTQGNYKQAKPLYERALKIVNKFFKPDHPRVRLYSKNYARLLGTMKKQKSIKLLNSKGWLRKRLRL